MVCEIGVRCDRLTKGEIRGTVGTENVEMVTRKKEAITMNNIFREKKWSPYVAGSLVGVLLCLSVLITEKYIGASTTFVRTAGMIERLVAPDHVNNNEYYASKKIKVDWQWMFVFGILFGSLITSKISGDFKLTYIPAMWKGRFGNSTTKRWIAAFFGGVIAMFGARLAGG